ncbi:hypothetical protein ACET3Z_011128 [Daucus carota]
MTKTLNRSRRNPSFMKLLFSDFSKKLLIPPKFARLHPGTLPKKCTLKPTGTQSSWPVRTILIDNHLYFKEGWKAFAKHHSLQHGDMLVFRYAQDSEFYVDMFDNTCCLREPVATSPALILPGQENKNDPETAADELILNSEFPSFKRTMQLTNVRSNGYLQIPLQFGRMYMKKITNYTSKLVSLDKGWVVHLLRGDKRVFKKGWSNFVKENSLELDDVCVFQLINAKDNTFEVTIFKKPGNEQGTLGSVL